MSENIRSARLRTSHTQQDVARFCGVSQALVSAWERGARTPSQKALGRLSKILCVPVEALQAK